MTASDKFPFIHNYKNNVVKWQINNVKKNQLFECN